ncbi:hypothetical protein AXW93_03675 [Pseudomonas aeruginosa]|uniref:hypothetical protein n=1 Tax=Pseudomonas aeruginosa TaxID=287 RepID=UPI0009BAC8F2|nr:hypothetical protein [Pseudomonas aeruginosa]ARC77950.1 hypothetical protein AXW93_03675 [Pseudomonas aeruginosa]
MLQANVRVGLLPADKKLLRKIAQHAREIGSFLSPDELLTARYIENLLLRLITPILTEGALAKAATVESISHLQREIGDAAIIISPPEIKLRLFAYLLPLVAGDVEDTELLRRILFPREIAIDE